MKYVLVTWLDASGGDGSVSSDEQVGVLRKSLGFLLSSNAEGVIIAQTRDAWASKSITYERGYNIPRSYVKSVKVLGTIP